MSQLFRGDITNSVAELTLLDEEVIGGGAGTLSYGLGGTNNGEILTVSKGDFPDYSAGSNPYYNDTNFRGLVIGTSCTTIGSYAFYYCNGLTGSLVIPDSVTTIGDYAFNMGFSSDSWSGPLTIGNSVTSIGSYAFRYCIGLTGDLVIPDSVTSIGSYAFYYCQGFNGSLTIGNSVTTITSYSFGGCSGLTGPLVIPNSVTSISNYAFFYCSLLTTAYLAPPLANVGSQAFYVSGLTTVYAKDAVASGWTLGAGQTVGGKTGVTVIDWTNYPNIP